jgi:beta-N-acetylhexosaminidase
LSGSIAARARSALGAGCDMVLHCNGKLDEMREVAAAVPLLAGAAAERADAALARRGQSVPGDVAAWRAEFACLMAQDWPAGARAVTA